MDGRGTRSYTSWWDHAPHSKAGKRQDWRQIKRTLKDLDPELALDPQGADRFGDTDLQERTRQFPLLVPCCPSVGQGENADPEPETRKF